MAYIYYLFSEAVLAVLREMAVNGLSHLRKELSANFVPFPDLDWQEAFSSERRRSNNEYCQILPRCVYRFCFGADYGSGFLL
jgi:hypothetical protein